MDVKMSAPPSAESQEYHKENFSMCGRCGAAHPSHEMCRPVMMNPNEQGAASGMAHKEQSNAWRNPSGFGLANILNRSVSGTNPSVPALPKFSLPSLHSFGKPLITKPEMAPTSSASSETGMYDVPMATRKIKDLKPQAHQQQQQQQQQQHMQAQQMQHQAKASPTAAPSVISSGGRKIAPAPPEDEDGAENDDDMVSIRGGRWTADEHERFLAGFKLHGHKWKRVQQIVRTRSVTQVRTHAQKYLLKLAKMKADKKQNKMDVTMATVDGGDMSDSSNIRMKSPMKDEEEDDDMMESGSRQISEEEMSPETTPHKRMRREKPTAVRDVDEEYIAAAASTLCFLMRQNIDSIFEGKTESGKDLEPYEYPRRPEEYGSSSPVRDRSRKREYLRFTEEKPAVSGTFSF